MSNQSTTPGPVEIAPLEMMGAIAARLLHDLANHLSVISGNAQFAQMVAGNPEKIAKAVASIVKASEVAGQLVGKCGEFKHLVAGATPRTMGADVESALRERLRSHRGWTLEIPREIRGPVLLELAWIVQAVTGFIAQAGSGEGTITLREVAFEEIPHRPGRRLRCVPPTRLLEVCLEYAAESVESIDQIKSAFDNLPLLASYEMILMAGGWVEIVSSGKKEHQTWLYFPVADSTG